MTQPPDALVFDTGPLRHFAAQSWLGVLKFLAGERNVLIPESVERELKRQVHNMPVLRQVLEADWICVDRSDDLPFVMAFAEYEKRLAVGEPNLGECGVLALGKTRGFETVLDDSTPRNIAAEETSASRLRFRCSAMRSAKASSPCRWWRRWQTT